MGRTACTEPQCLYKGALYLIIKLVKDMCRIRDRVVAVKNRVCFERPRHRGSIPGRYKGFLPYPSKDTKPPIDCATGDISPWIKQ